MQVTMIGLGGGTEQTMTQEGRQALLQADFVAGAARLLERLPAGCTQRRGAATKPDALLRLIVQSGAERPCVVYSGDTGFYSGARSLAPLLQERGADVRILPGISSVQLLSARLCRPWQDWVLVSAHGVACNAVAAVSQGRPALFLTGGTLGPAALCAQLCAAGLGGLGVTVAENLSYPEERIRTGAARDFSGEDLAPLSVLLAEAAPCAPVHPGMDDRAFVRGDVPMTKQEVRAAALAKLEVRSGETVWDVGAGTGSVSVELARCAWQGRVYAVERASDACALIRENRERFGAWNLSVVEGAAPEALETLPAPDAVFIGGSGGQMQAVVEAVLAKNPCARMCISAIAVESLGAAVQALTAHGREASVAQIAVSRSRPAGGLHMMTAQNPVWLVTG